MEFSESDKLKNKKLNKFQVYQNRIQKKGVLNPIQYTFFYDLEISRRKNDSLPTKETIKKRIMVGTEETASFKLVPSKLQSSKQ